MCSLDIAGADRVYSISVPGGKKLTASVVPTGTGDPAIYLVAGPASNCTMVPVPCLAGDDSGAASQTNTAAYTNTGTSPQTIFVVIDSIAAAVSSFTLTTALDAP